jgi:hypothetical protein
LPRLEKATLVRTDPPSGGGPRARSDFHPLRTL